jgi:thiamine kinase-like enzyme
LIERGWPQSRIEDYIRALPIWRNEPVLEPLIGGLQNTSYTVTDEAGKRVARLGFDEVHLGTVQTSVLASARAGAELGLSPAISHYEPNLFVMDFIEGECLTEEETREPALVARVIDELIAPLHAGGHAAHDPVIHFSGFMSVRNNVHYVREWAPQSPHRPRAEEALATIETIERVIEPHRPVFSHNDLAFVNIMRDTDDRLWLIDWDFGGFNHPLWDIAELCAYAISDETLDRFVLEHSLGPLDEAAMSQALREHRAFKLASYLRQVTWCILQAHAGSRTVADAAVSMERNFPAEDAEDSYEGFMDIAWGRYRFLWESCRDDY